MPSEEGTAVADLTLRPAEPDDAEALSTLLLDAREAAYPSMPRLVHPPDDVRHWLRSRFDVDGVEVWLAERDDVPVGLLLLEDAWLHSVYVAPGRPGRGAGGLLLGPRTRRRPDGRGLWAVDGNVDAQ